MVIRDEVLKELLEGVRPQWELRPALALGDQRFAFALPLGARTSAHFSCRGAMENLGAVARRGQSLPHAGP
jgi:hypothetical protein